MATDDGALCTKCKKDRLFTLLLPLDEFEVDHKLLIKSRFDPRNRCDAMFMWNVQ